MNEARVDSFFVLACVFKCRSTVMLTNFCLQSSSSVFRENVIWTKLGWTRFLFSQQRPVDDLSSHPRLCLAGTHYLNVLQRHMQAPFSHICLSVTALS